MAEGVIEVLEYRTEDGRRPFGEWLLGLHDREAAVIVLLCGGDKRSQARDIALAQAYWADYQRRTT